jgi:peptidoglycan/LPS O-acetylase OafA/YrhL
MPYRPEVDGLRAVAVLAVLLFHAGGLLPGGFAGVDVFFVISGYVITSVVARELDAGRFTIANFYERRVRRIAPALLATISLTAVGAALVLLPPDLDSFGESAIAATLMVSNVKFWLEAGYFDVAAQAKPLLHTWSLAIEEQFYLVYPLLLVAIWRKGRGVVLAVLAALFAVSLAASLWAVQAEPSAAFYLAPFRFWELLLGALIALYPVKRLEGSGPAALGLAMIAASYLVYDSATPFPGAAALLPTLGAALAINGARSGSLAARGLGAAPLVFVGRISYSLYLVHWPLIVLIEYRQGAVLSGWQAAAVIAASLALATLSWRFVEQPFRRPASFGRFRRVFGAAAGAAFAICMLGAWLDVEDGLPGRLPPKAFAAYQARDDDWAESDGCFVDTKGRTGPSLAEIRDGRICSFGPKDRAPDFIVWGDSHAPAMTPAILAAAERHGGRGLFIGAGSCPPLRAFDTLGVRDATERRCHEINAAVLDYLARHPVKAAFMVARWPKYALGNEFGAEGLFFDPRKIPPPVAGEDEKLAAALDRTLGELRGIGVRPILVMAVPEPGYEVPYAYARALLQGDDTPDIAPPREAVAGRQRRAREILISAAQKHGGAMVDPTAALCDAAFCPVERDGRLLYKDADHITRSAAISISHIFDQSMAELMSPKTDGSPAVAD